MRPGRHTAASFAGAALCAAAAACGGSDGGAEERGHPAATPPPGWRTVGNEPAGFTLAAPRSWAARTKRKATLIRSPGRSVAVTVAADRSRTGRELEPARYARATLEQLPGFEGSVTPRPRRIRGTPYRTARVDGQGSLRTSASPQRITVAAYHRPGLVTYAAVAFRNALARSPSDERVITRMLRTFRAGAPR